MLDRLDRHFAATLTGEEVARLPEATVHTLTTMGILASAGVAESVTHCLCELRRPECVVTVDAVADGFQGYCDEYGAPFPVAVEKVRRYRFDWRAWADWLRRKNGLDGAGPVQGAGTLLVGSGTAGGREFALLVVAPGCKRAADVVLPEGARRHGRTLVALLLGRPTEGLPVDASVSVEALGPDFGTLDGAALDRALAAARPGDSTPQRWSGAPLTAKQAAPKLGYPSGSALLKAVTSERVHEGDPLYILRQGGPGRTPGGRFYEDAVAHVEGLLSNAGTDYDAGVKERMSQARAAKAATPPVKPEVAQRRLLKALARREKESR